MTARTSVAAALRAAALTKSNDAHVLSTLAAAYAETGNFANAILWQQRALARLTTSVPSEFGLQDRLKACNDRLKLYKSGKSFRLPP